MRWFHLHSAVLRTYVQGQHIYRDFTGSLDDTFFPLIFDSTENLYFAEDSDEISFCSIMQDWQVEDGTRLRSVATLSSWAENNAQLLHREFFNQSFLYHSTDMNPAHWDPAVKKSEWVARQVEKRLLIPDTVLALMDPGAFGDRRARQQRYNQNLFAWPSEAPGNTGDVTPKKIPEILDAVERVTDVGDWVPTGAILDAAEANGFTSLSETDEAGEHFVALGLTHEAGSAITGRVRVRSGGRFNLRLYLIAESDTGYADFHLYGSGNLHAASVFGDTELLGTEISSTNGEVFDCALSVKMPAGRAHTSFRVQLLDYGRNSIYPGEPGMGFGFAPATLWFHP